MKLDQINTTNNVYDRAPLLTLAYVSIESTMFRETKTIGYVNSQFKRLQSGMIDELKVSIVDENGVPINNHSMPISVIFEIKKKLHCKD